ncbi:MAG: prolyl oligopeptidase family serine peptidase [Parvularculaceae bacterium]
MLKTIAAASAALAGLAASADAAGPKGMQDEFLWLEDVEGKKQLDWVRAENARSLGELEADPRYGGLFEDALSILTSTARIPYGEIHNGQVYNFWQDETQVRGVWRRASLDSYKTGAPAWESLIDFDKLAADEGENWIHGDIACLSPEYRHCMVEMSYGGKDAAVWREFDATEKKFVDGGFYLPEAKSGLAWIDENTLLVGTDRGAGTLTDSGYARTLVRLGRRAELKTAPVFAEGETKDVALNPRVEHDGGKAHIFAQRGVSFFETEYWYSPNVDASPVKLALPLNADLQGVFAGRAVFSLREPWSFKGAEYPQGSVVAYDLSSGASELVFAANDRQSVEDIEIGKSGIVIQYLDDVSGKAARLTLSKNGWKSKEIKMPANGVVALVSVGGGTDDALLSFESLTVPDTLYFVSAKNKVERIAQAPAYYDASDVVVEQRFATSKDGTRVPYFIMAKKDVLAAGNAPTVQYGYGGFLAATLPVYYEDPARPQHGALGGKLWVSRGGVLVLSNIRGGSEYGPKWHQAGLKENRQVVFDDFIAISEHLIETGVTTAEKLGAIGRSNGGLLMGAMLTQRPELYHAMVVGVPLFDMQRYNKLLAGASWMGEYGDPDKPEEWAYISQYSPYQKLAAGEAYPKVLFYTSTKDDRVHPGHARKAAARLKQLGYPYYYYENIEGGHGGTANQEQLSRRIALEYGYFAHMLMGEGATSAGSE